MKNGTRFAALGGIVVAGALALSACGSDNNSSGNGPTAAAPAAGDCAKGTISGSGSSAQKVAMLEWTKAFQQGCGTSTTVNYNGDVGGSGAGIQQFTSGQVTFAGSDSALKPEQKAPADARCKTGKAINLPMVVSPIEVIYKLDGVDLNLSPATIAGIFNGKILKWNDAAIKKDNGSATLPDKPIKVVHRSDDSGTSENLTKFLKGTAPTGWPYEPNKVWPNKIGQGAKGGSGLVQTVSTTDGSIGYVALADAKAAAGTKAAKVANGAGKFVELSTDNATKAIDAAKVTQAGNDFKVTADYGTKADGAYPIVQVTYEITCEKGLAADQAKLVQAFLAYTSSDKGQSALTTVGYAPLPTTLAGKVQAAVKAIA